MSLEKLKDALIALRALGAAGVDDDLIDLARAVAGLSPAAAKKAIQVAGERAVGVGGATAGDSAVVLEQLDLLLETVAAAKGVRFAARTLAEALREAPTLRLAALAAALREAEAAKRAASARKAEAAAARAEKTRAAAERVETYVRRLRRSEPERGALFAIVEEMKAEGRALSALDWKAVAQRLSGGGGASKGEAERRILGWIATQLQSADAKRAVDRLHQISA